MISLLIDFLVVLIVLLALIVAGLFIATILILQGRD